MNSIAKNSVNCLKNMDKNFLKVSRRKKKTLLIWRKLRKRTELSWEIRRSKSVQQDLTHQLESISNNFLPHRKASCTKIKQLTKDKISHFPPTTQTSSVDLHLKASTHKNRKSGGRSAEVKKSTKSRSTQADTPTSAPQKSQTSTRRTTPQSSS